MKTHFKQCFLSLLFKTENLCKKEHWQEMVQFREGRHQGNFMWASFSLLIRLL